VLADLSGWKMADHPSRNASIVTANNPIEQYKQDRTFGPTISRIRLNYSTEDQYFIHIPK
jgi:hypothetical protein